MVEMIYPSSHSDQGLQPELDSDGLASSGQAPPTRPLRAPEWPPNKTRPAGSDDRDPPVLWWHCPPATAGASQSGPASAKDVGGTEQRSPDNDCSLRVSSGSPEPAAPLGP